MDVGTCLNNARASSSKWWLRSSSESTVGTLVNRDTTSNLTIRSSGCTCGYSNICVLNSWWGGWEFGTQCEKLLPVCPDIGICHPPSYWLRLFLSQTFSHINTPTFLKPSHSPYLPAYEDGTECSEMLAYKIQISGNYPEESIQHSEHGESLKSRTKKLLHKTLPFAWTSGVCVLLQHLYRWPDKKKFKILL